MKIISVFSFVALTSMGVFYGCTKDKVSVKKLGTLSATDCTDSISFSAKILPLMQQNCSTTGCHDAGSAASGYVLTSHASISDNADIIYRSISHSAGVQPMPQGADKLNDSLIKNFGCWVLQGKLNN